MSGCSTVLGGHNSAFRNRENDYAKNQVVQPQPLKTPEGLPALKTNPEYTVPKGQNDYPANAKAMDLSPPGLHDSITTPNANSSSVVVKKTHANLSSSIAFTKDKAGLLTVDAPFDTSWAALPAALKAMNYHILKSDKKQGTLDIQSDSNKAHSFLLYASNKESSVTTQISLFDTKGKLLSTELGYSLLQQLKANLHD